jgi:hypothetical protein
MPSPAQDEIMPRWTTCVNELFRHGGFLTSSEERVGTGDEPPALGKIWQTGPQGD